MILELGTSHLTINTIEHFLKFPDGKIAPTKNAKEKILQSRKVVEKITHSDKVVYGINTGFGALSNKSIPKDKLEDLQVNLIRSHCTGVGEPLNNEWAQLLMILRAHCLSMGFSGVSPQVVDLLCTMVNKKITPIIPSKGSVGASGDLAPLAHLALSLIGEGSVIFDNHTYNANDLFSKLNISPVTLGAKDGLALINGTSMMATLSVSAIIRAKKLFKLADLAAALTLEATRGTRVAFNPKITQLKPHQGQIDVVNNILKILPESEISNSHKDCEKVQDPYSIRCVPQVHGACRQALYHAIQVTETEINSVTDNPLVFSEEEIFSGGNFHGECLAICMDYLSMAMSELGNISERRIEKMMNPIYSGLPAFLTKDSGLNSGLMIAQVTAAALASENKTYSFPASVDSIPTSTDKEDHVSMGVGAGLKLHRIIDNLESILSIEFLCNYQALLFLRPLKSTPSIENVIKSIQALVPPIDKDRNFSIDIQNINTLIRNGEIIRACETSSGPLT